MYMRRHREVLTAGNQRYALDRVVRGDGEVVARRKLLAREHHIAKYLRLRAAPVPVFVPVERASQSESTGEVEAQCVIRSRALLSSNVAAGQPAADAGITRSGIPLWGASGPRDLVLDLTPRAKT